MSAAQVGPALSIDRLTVRYGNHLAVRSVSLEVAPGELLALAGPNGSGKSTLLRAVVGLVPVEEGAIRVRGSSLARRSFRERALEVGWMPQEEEVGDNVPLEQYVEYGRYAHVPPFASVGTDDRRAVASALAEVDLTRFVGRGMRELSGGERQRARLARVLAQETPILLLDEATSHLDMGHQLDILARVKAVARRERRAVVLALHDLNLAARYADRVAVLSRGNLVAEGGPAEVLSADLLLEVWGVVAQLRRDPASGLPYLIPELPRLGPPTPRPGGARPKVHVVGGGGSAASLLQRLAEEGYELSAGVLPLFDSDTQVADELRIPTAAEVPFAPLGPEARQRNHELTETSDAVVVAPFPVGPANLANLEDLREFVGRLPMFLVSEPPIGDRDFTGGRAVELYEELKGTGAREVANASELLPALRSVGSRGSASTGPSAPRARAGAG